MPCRPKRPCAHPGCPELVDKGYCEKHQKYRRTETKEQRRAQDQRRGSAHERGYTSKWQRYSQRFLRQPDNVFCKLQLPGCTNLAQCVDHIQPPASPDDPLFWKPENHQAACIHCNSVKGRRMMIGKAEPFEANIGIAEQIEFRPRDLKPSAIPLTIVCGPPAAGKSTYVREHKAPGDIVIDLGEIKAELAGTVEYDASDKWLASAMKIRNERLHSLASETRSVKAWFIVGSPTIKERRYWNDALRPVNIVVLATPESVCIDRIMSDPLRKNRIITTEEQIQFVKKWWRQYLYNP